MSLTPSKNEPPRILETRQSGFPTIHDVARHAGVSTSTVSRSFSGESRISLKTREQIRRIAQELGYRPSRSAQALRSAKTGTIGLLVPTLENPIAYDHLRATIRAAFEVGYTVLVADGQDTAEIQEAELMRLRDFRVDGLIVGRGLLPITKTLIEVARSGIPIEPPIEADVLNSEIGTLFNPYRLATSDDAGATVAYRRLAAIGHRRFAIFTLARATTRHGRPRAETFVRVLGEAGIASEHILTMTIQDPHHYTTEVQDVLARPNPPTAIVVSNGRVTPYILEAIHAAGLRIPDDLSFLCFGDSQWHRGYAPPLAVVREDYAAVAQQIVERVVARIDGREAPELVKRPSEFVPRASIAPPRELKRSELRSPVDSL